MSANYPTIRILQSVFDDCLKQIGANFTLRDVLELYAQISPSTMKLNFEEEAPYLDISMPESQDYYNPDDYADDGGPVTSGVEDVEYID